MHSLLRNTFLASLLFIILLSVVKCGSNTKDKQDNTVEENKTYKNLSSDVKYVGINKCRQCHYDKYETFIETGMGKSFDKATRTKSSVKFEKHSVVYDKSSDLSYFPFWSGDTMKIMEFRSEGKDTIHKRIETVNYIIGSGQHTNSHLFNTNGYLHQMPITFYTQKGKWDMAPGFDNGNNARFSRPIGLECMSCHNALPEFVKGSENKYENLLDGISCERCHGPGEIHVQEKTAGIKVDTSKYIDYSIVNPAKLSIDLQFDVCQRCHLQGNSVLKEGKSFYDFHPGMKLSDVMTVFLPTYEGADEEFIMASHADRLKMSPCFIKTNQGKENTNTLRPYKNGLTCVTCHNPHISVKVTGKEVFNNACKNCHGGKIQMVCTEQLSIRNQQQNNCINCHMPQSGSIDIPHVRVTDHFIRKPVKKTDVAGIKKFIGLFAINERQPSAKTIAEGYLNQYEKFGLSPVFLDSAKKYLSEKSLQEITENLNLLIRLYFLKKDYVHLVSLVSKFSQKEILQQLNKASWNNEDAWTCYRIGEAYANLHKPNEAYAFFKKADELASFNPEFKNKLASILCILGRINEAKTIYEKIINENPDFASAWNNLGFMYLQNGNKEKAKQYYDKALALDPDYEQALLNQAGLFLYENKNKEALAVVKKILKKNPANQQARAITTQLTR